VRVATSEKLEAVKSEFPEILVHYMGRPGKWLSSEPQDPQSFRYLIVNLGAQSRHELQENYQRVLEMLPDPFGHEPSVGAFEKKMHDQRENRRRDGSKQHRPQII